MSIFKFYFAAMILNLAVALFFASWVALAMFIVLWVPFFYYVKVATSSVETIAYTVKEA